MKRLLFYCQHVLGMGHLVRSLELIRGLDSFQVCYLNGGEMVAGLDLPRNVRVVNLPVIRSDEDFREIHAEAGEDIETVKMQRTACIQETIREFLPDVVVIELFPFGRRKFAFELIPMLDSLRALLPASKVVCSVRDIVVSKLDRERFENKVRSILDRYFDLVLVHSDPEFQRLEESFVTAGEIRCPVVYTGFVARQPMDNLPAEERDSKVRMVASIGGGRVGGELLLAVVGASGVLSEAMALEMEIFTGPFLPEEQFCQLRAMSSGMPSVRVERYTPSLPSRLRAADLSISMAGYNTCMDIVVSGVPSLLYPFTGGENEEQTTRARKLQALGAATVLDSYDLNPSRLAAKIRVALNHPTTRVVLDTNGVRRSAELLMNLAATA